MSELVFNRVILEKQNRVLAIVVMITLSLNLILAILLMAIIHKPPLVVYSDEGQISVLKTKGLKLDETSLKDFMTMIVGQYLNFSSTSLPAQIEGISKYLSVKPKQAILDSYKQNQSTIEKEDIAQQFVIKTQVITKTSNPYWVEVTGTRTIYANGNNKSAPKTYIFEVQRIKCTESNPYGLRVSDVVEKKEKL